MPSQVLPVRRATPATLGEAVPVAGGSISSLDPHDVRVMVGDGRKAHIFRSGAGVDFNLAQLQDGAAVFDVALCGTGGEMVLADDGIDVCAHCARKLESERT